MVTAATNIGALSSKRFLELNQSRATRATEELASGSRVSNPSYDPASAAIGYSLGSSIDSLNQASRNVAQAKSMLYMGTGVLGSQNEVMSRMKTIAAQANTDTIGSSERKMLNDEFTQLKDQIDKNVDSGEWGGVKLFSGSGGTVTAGPTAVAAATATGAVNPAAGDNTFLSTGVFNATNTQGYVTGIVSDVTVTANGATYDVSMKVGDQTFTANTAPTAAGVLVLTSTTDSGSKIGINYHATDVSGLGTAANFQTALRTAMGVDTGTKAAFTSVNTTAGALANVTFTAGAGTTAGEWALTYTGAAAGGTGEFKLTNGVEVYKATATTAASMTTTVGFSNGVSLSLAGFNGTTNRTQEMYAVAAGSQINMEFQVGADETSVLNATFKGATTTALGLSGLSVVDKTSAKTAADTLKTGMDVVSGYIAELGGKVSQLNFLGDNLKVSVQNREAAKSTFVDSNIAESMMNSQKYKSLSQISGHVFTQALQETARLAAMVQQAG